LFFDELVQLNLFISTKRVDLALKILVASGKEFYRMVPGTVWGEFVEIFLGKYVWKIVEVIGNGFLP
jgi:hypothetical protein